MKVLIVSEDVPHPQLGGLGKHAIALAHALHRRGHVVDVLGNADRPIESHPEQAGPGRFFGGIRGHAKGWKERSLGMYTPLRVLLNARSVRRAILRYSADYDVVHYHGHLPWAAASLPRHVRFIQTRHDQGGDCMLNTRFLPSGQRCTTVDARACASCATAQPNQLQRWVTARTVQIMRRMTVRAYDRHAVVFVSKFLQDGIARMSGVAACGSVLHNAIDDDALMTALGQTDSGKFADEDPARLLLFSAGSIAAHKGYRELLTSLAHSALPRSTALVIAGDGPLLQELASMNHTSDVRLLGWRSYQDIAQWVARADAIVVPSVWDEPCATTILEGLALGRPVYALDRGGSPELRRYVTRADAELHLFPDMASLVTALRAHTVKLPRTAKLVPGFAATMNLVAAQLERRYEALVST